VDIKIKNENKKKMKIEKKKMTQSHPTVLTMPPPVTCTALTMN